MFKNLDSLIVFGSEFQRIGAISSNSMVGKRFPVISQVEIIDMSCLVIVDIRTFHEIFFES